MALIRALFLIELDKLDILKRDQDNLKIKSYSQLTPQQSWRNSCTLDVAKIVKKFMVITTTSVLRAKYGDTPSALVE